MSTETTWTWDDTYRAWAPTTDPRVLAIIQRQDYPDAPDGDVYAPAYVIDHHGHITPAGGTYRDVASDELAHRYVQAREHFRAPQGSRRANFDVDELVARWLRIFYSASAVEVRSTAHQSGGSVLILNTPSWREHTGATESTTWRVTSVTAPGQGLAESEHDVETAELAAVAHVLKVARPTLDAPETRRITSCERVSILAGDVAEWQAYLDGDVFGIGYAIKADDSDDVDLDLTHDVTMTCWGLYGEEDAQRAALEEAPFSAADELKAREAAEAAAARELAELAQREREAAVDRADLAAGLLALDALISTASPYLATHFDAFRLARWGAAARFVDAVELHSTDTENWHGLEGLSPSDVERLDELVASGHTPELVAQWAADGGDYANDGADERLSSWLTNNTPEV